MEIVDTGHNKSFNRGGLRRVTRKTTTSELENNGVREALESAIIREETRGPMFQAIAIIVFKEKKLAATVAKFLIEQAKKKVNVTAQQLVSSAPQSRPNCLVIHVWQKKCKNQRKSKSRRNVEKLWHPRSPLTERPGPYGAPSKESVDQRPQLVSKTRK